MLKFEIKHHLNVTITLFITLFFFSKLKSETNLKKIPFPPRNEESLTKVEIGHTLTVLIWEGQHFNVSIKKGLQLNKIQ